MTPCIAPSRVTLLDDLVANQHLSNGYIFEGQSGSFTDQAARYLIIQALGLEQLDHHPDVIQIDTEGKSITVDTIRSIQEAVKYGPSQSPYLFVTIHHAERMTNEAANAFLKTLEEAEKGVCFLLLTRSKRSLLSTIRSRCQHLYFPSVSDTQLKEYVETQLQQSYDELSASHHNNRELLLAHLEQGEESPENYQSLLALRQLSLSEGFKFIESVAQDKHLVRRLLLCWIRDSLSTPEFLPPLVTTLERLQYNVNVRLQLESLLIQLNSLSK